MTENKFTSSPSSPARRYVGEAVLRAEDECLLRGAGGFLPNLPAPDAAEICIVRSTVPHALLRAIAPERVRYVGRRSS
jgi:CO/xanthine dehydrogenase Mo-binding subunit